MWAESADHRNHLRLCLPRPASSPPAAFPAPSSPLQPPSSFLPPSASLGVSGSCGLLLLLTERDGGQGVQNKVRDRSPLRLSGASPAAALATNNVQTPSAVRHSLLSHPPCPYTLPVVRPSVRQARRTEQASLASLSSERSLSRRAGERERASKSMHTRTRTHVSPLRPPPHHSAGLAGCLALRPPLPLAHSASASSARPDLNRVS